MIFKIWRENGKISCSGKGCIMKQMLVCLFSLILLFTLPACGEQSDTVLAPSSQPAPSERDIENKSDSLAYPKENREDETMKISIKSSDYEIIYELNDSPAAKELYVQLPLTLEVQPFSDNEMTFYPPEKLDTADTPLSGGRAGSLSYYAPWGDVVMFYAPCNPNGSLYELGTVISGGADISQMNGSITVSVYQEQE